MYLYLYVYVHMFVCVNPREQPLVDTSVQLKIHQFHDDIVITVRRFGDIMTGLLGIKLQMRAFKRN